MVIKLLLIVKIYTRLRIIGRHGRIRLNSQFKPDDF
jgi:hypothetical protein